MSVEHLCTFEVDRLLIGIEIEAIQEVLRAQPLTPVPHASSAVAGLMSLRGQILPVLDLRARLCMRGPQTEGERFNIVVRTENGPVSLLVDKIGDVIDVGPDSFEPVPETLNGLVRPFLRGTYKLKDRLLLALDVAAVVEL